MNGDEEHLFGEVRFSFRIGKIPNFGAHGFFHLRLYHELLHFSVRQHPWLVAIIAWHHHLVLFLLLLGYEPRRIPLLRAELLSIRHHDRINRSRCWWASLARSWLCGSLHPLVLIWVAWSSAWCRRMVVIKAWKGRCHIQFDWVLTCYDTILHVSDEA